MKPIVQDGHPVLREVAKEVPQELFGSKELAGWLRDMEEALDKEPDGVALAAPQIALPYRIFMVRYDRMIAPPESGPQLPAEVGIFINPKFTKLARRRVEVDEGCLSVRGLYGKTNRHERATVSAFDPSGKSFERGGGGILAQAFQHEMDHLNGILFIDHAHDIQKPAERAHRPFVFFGTPLVGSRTLELLSRRGFRPSLIITSPDAHAGRGMKLLPSPVKEWGLQHGIRVLSPEKLDEKTLTHIQEVNADYGIVVAYGKILPKSYLSAFPLGLLNIHYSLLPKYRGASPVESALLNGEEETGVTIQKMAAKIDAGDILAQKSLSIEPEETTRELRGRLVRLGAFLLSDVLPFFEGGTLSAYPQNEKEATLAPKITKEEGELIIPGNDESNWRKYRAYAESPGTYFFMERQDKKIRVKIKTAKCEHGIFTPLRVVPEGKKETDYSALSAPLQP